MAEIKPFRAIIYNKAKEKDISKVTCPPYDVISPTRQQYYHSLSPHNFIHIILGKDIPGEDKYERAGQYFKAWQQEQVLIREERSALYFYSQQYSLKGESRQRLGFIGLLHLDNKKSSVYRHENTRMEAKEDRLRLLRQAKANLSPIFVVFGDKKRIVQSVYEKYILHQDPFIDITDDEKTTHKLWRIDSLELLADIQAKMQEENIFIADGHHRYEVACAYREEMKKKLGETSGKEDFNYILTYFTNVSSKGLTILPIHRLVKLSPLPLWSDFLVSLREYFDVDEYVDSRRFFFLMEKAGQAEHVLGVYKDKKYWLLRLKNIKILDKLIADKPKPYRFLDVSILNYLILKNILGFDLEDKKNITFNPHADEMISEVDNSTDLAAFFLNPVKVDQMVSVALTGERMPPKSTYFYPKVLSGLVINKHEIG